MHLVIIVCVAPKPVEELVASAVRGTEEES